jgi:hypothetical protein
MKSNKIPAFGDLCLDGAQIFRRAPDTDGPLMVDGKFTKNVVFSTLGDYLKNPRLHRDYGLCFGGLQGCGKTPVLKSCAYYLAVASLEGAGKDINGAKFMFCTNLECLASVQDEFTEHTPIAMDEADFFASEQFHRNGGTILKHIVCPAEAGNPSTRQGKDGRQNVRLAQNQPRLFATNQTNHANWTGLTGLTEANNQLAIEKKCFFMHVKKQLIPESLRANYDSKPEERFGEAIDVTDDVANLLKQD